MNFDPSDLPPVTPEAIAEAARRMLAKKRPPGGWKKKPKEDKKNEGES